MPSGWLLLPPCGSWRGLSDVIKLKLGMSLFHLERAEMASYHRADVRQELLWALGGIASVDVRHFAAFQTVVANLSGELHVAYIEYALVHSFVHDATEEGNLGAVEILAHAFHFPDFAEELGAECTVAEDGFLDDFEVCKDELNHFFFRRDVLASHFLKACEESLEFGLDDSEIYILLALEIGVECASSLA